MILELPDRTMRTPWMPSHSPAMRTAMDGNMAKRGPQGLRLVSKHASSAAGESSNKLSYFLFASRVCRSDVSLMMAVFC